MSYITRNLLQKATVFSRSTPDGYGGYSYKKTTVNCRWQEKQILFVDAHGEEKTSRAVIYVDSDISIGSFIYLGVTNSTTPPQEAYEILSFSKSPNLRATEFQRKVIV